MWDCIDVAVSKAAEAGNEEAIAVKFEGVAVGPLEVVGASDGIDREEGLERKQGRRGEQKREDSFFN